MQRLIMTVCYVLRNGCVLLGTQRERKGHRNLNVGLWNGTGGLVEPGETLLKSSNRETRDEAGIRPQTARRMGVALITYAEEAFEVELHYFLCRHWRGIPKISDEVKLWRWTPLHDMPFDEMWPADRYTFPAMVLDGRRIMGHIHYDNTRTRTLLQHDIRSLGRTPLPAAETLQRLF